jgi:positive regulator of sigma E activity
MTDDEDSGEIEQDRFGLKHMSTEQEVIASFALYLMGTLLIVANIVPLIGHVDLGPAMLGLVMAAAGYLFVIESVRELEEKDHFLARKLRKKD